MLAQHDTFVASFELPPNAKSPAPGSSGFPTLSPKAGEKGGAPLDLIAGLVSLTMTCYLLYLRVSPLVGRRSEQALLASSRERVNNDPTAHSLAYDWEACL